MPMPPHSLGGPTAPSYRSARTHARAIAGVLARHLSQASPVTEIATIADTSRLLEFGYVSATATQGPINVVGISGADLPLLVPGMRILVRRLRRDTHESYLFDGFAPGTKPLASSSGALQVTRQTSGVGGAGPVGLATLGSTSIPTASAHLTTLPNLSSYPGVFLSFAFQVPRVPPVGTQYVLAEIGAFTTSGANQVLAGGVQIVYTAQGSLGVAQRLSWPGGSFTASATTASFAPGRIWWPVFSFGNALAINGARITDGSYDLSALSSITFPAGKYGFWLLTDSAVASPCPPGTWISKVIFGLSNTHALNPSTSWTWPYAIQTDPEMLDSSLDVPLADDDVSNGNAATASGLTVYNRFLMADATGGALTDTGLAGLAGAGAQNLPILGDAAIITSGPY